MAVIYTHSIHEAFLPLLEQAKPDKIFVLADETTQRCCLPQLQATNPWTQGAEILTMPVGDVAKNLETLASVWQSLTQKGATRHSLLVNLGGGVVTDLGGFAAATFKRGIDFVNIPTTLLAMVDAAVGGKTGINFNGLKNEIGAFRPACHVFIDTEFLRTLDAGNLRSGYAEMLKHALLQDTEMWAGHLRFDIDFPDYSQLSLLVRQSIEVKEKIVTQDPFEKGLRKALNLGHTFGHAFESFALQEGRPVLHGYAVAWGLVCELYLSVCLLGFPTQQMQQTVRFIRQTYGDFHFTCKDYDTLLAFIRHDKKNVGGHIHFSLLSDIGKVELDRQATPQLIFEAFDFLREG